MASFVKIIKRRGHMKDMFIAHWYNENGRGVLKYSENNLS
jgi:hypothetical protein